MVPKCIVLDDRPEFTSVDAFGVLRLVKGYNFNFPDKPAARTASETGWRIVSPQANEAVTPVSGWRIFHWLEP